MTRLARTDVLLFLLFTHSHFRQASLVNLGQFLSGMRLTQLPDAQHLAYHSGVII